jgi:tetratricopeptide (TPR) repeat protein
MLGRLQRKAGQLDQAISHFSDSIQYDPNLIEAYIELGKTYQDRRDLEQAIKVFQKGAKVNIADPRPYYHAGMALKDCKDYAGAEAMLKQAKKYAPDDPIIIRQLGVITALNLVNNLRETR